jgi:hypothetical protein
METRFIYHLIFFFTFFSVYVHAQEKENDTIKTDELIITKKYSPTVNDAFKIKPKPQQKDTSKVKRKNIDYSIINIPVASTFTPSKGVASDVEKQPRPRLYDNFASLGAGSFANIRAAFHGNVELDRTKDLQVDLDHFSSAGGVDGTLLDDDFLVTDLGLEMSKDGRYTDWNTYVNSGYRSVNWYGINNATLASISENELNAIDPSQNYFHFDAGGSINPDRSFIDEIGLDYSLFSDDLSNTEHFIDLRPEFDLYFLDQLLETDLQVDYVSGNFAATRSSKIDRDYSFLNLRLYPHLMYEEGNFSADLGAQVVYNTDLEQSDSDVFVYPKIDLNYQIDESRFVAFAGARGNLEQNRYQTFVDNNPFVIPYLNIAPTDQQLKAFAGVKGKFLENLSFRVNGSYETVENYAFFISRPFNPQINNRKGFEYGNTFDVFYDDMQTLGFKLSLQYDHSKDLQMGLRAALNSYSTDDLPEAINLPELVYSFNSSYNITDKWSVSGMIFYRGERNDLQESNTTIIDGSSLVTIDDYMDVNLHFSYQLNEKLAIFIKGNNLLEGNYRRWKDYRVQSLQILGGLQFQFDW